MTFKSKSNNSDRNDKDGMMYSITSHHIPWIGGPGTILPRQVESFLCWSLAIGCLSVSGYHYLKQTIVFPLLQFLLEWTKWIIFLTVRSNHDTISKDTTKDHLSKKFSYWIPLTTTSRREQSSKTCMERYEQLIQMMEVYCNQNSKTKRTCDQVEDEELVQLIRTNPILRRLATLAMNPYNNKNAKNSSSRFSSISPMDLPLGQRLVRLWPQLLALPQQDQFFSHSKTVQTPTSNENTCDISIIVPAFREMGEQVLQRIRNAQESCVSPESVQLVLVDAGDCQDFDHDDLRKKLSKSLKTTKAWGQVVVQSFQDGGGRGPCLNYGASLSSGRILTFCHSDTQLPIAWDEKIKMAFAAPTTTKSKPIPVPTACAFSFGISQDETINGPIPPGIRAVETTANWRTHLYSLPYGDQCLSIPAYVFEFLGGYPDQCLMEDYELIGLLRLRIATFSKVLIANNTTGGEVLNVIPEPPALCSPRRWQKFGVLYVTWTNSKCVNLYAKGMEPDDLFREYYGKPPPQRKLESSSPWELEMETLLQRQL